MKVLWISHFVPWPPKGGNLQRSYYLIRALAREAEIDLVTFHRRRSLAEMDLAGAEAALREICRDVAIFPIPNESSRISFAAGLARNLFERDPYTVAELHSARFTRKIRDWAGGREYDAVHFDTIDLAGYRSFAGDLPAVLNHHNVESLLFRRRAPYEKNRLAGAYLRLQAGKVERYENKSYGSFAANLFVSTADMERARLGDPGLLGEVVPNGVDTEYYSPGGGEEEESVAWVGGLGWFPNRDAVAWLLDEIWPRVVRERPEARLDLIGSAPASLVPKGADARGVKVHGFVDDLRPIVRKAAVFVVPIRVGGGTRLKILDAMAMGKAIVTTTVGCEGIDPERGKEMILADTPEEIAAETVRLLGDAEKRRELGRNARALAERRFAWSVVGNRFLEIYRRLAAGSGPATEGDNGS